MVELRRITQENFDDVISLKVAQHQKTFVSTTAHSLAQAWLYADTAFPFAIYADNTPVGFVMMGYYKSRNQYTLWKFFIDQKHQRKGYGKQALRLAVDYLLENFGTREVYTGVLLGNEAAKHLYTSFGFESTGLIEDNMEEMRYVPAE